MQIIIFVIVVGVLAKMIYEYEPPYKKIKKSDKDPNNSIKSDKWHREHSETRK